MTQATDPDIRELRSEIAANTSAISSLSSRVDTLVTATEANTKAIADLTLEMRTGFTKLEGKIDVVKSEIGALDLKYEERSKGTIARLDAKDLTTRNINTGLTVTIVGGLLLTLAKFLFFGSTP